MVWLQSLVLAWCITKAVGGETASVCCLGEDAPTHAIAIHVMPGQKTPQKPQHARYIAWDPPLGWAVGDKNVTVAHLALKSFHKRPNLFKQDRAG